MKKKLQTAIANEENKKKAPLKAPVKKWFQQDFWCGQNSNQHL